MREDPCILLDQVDLHLEEMRRALSIGICRAKLGCALTASLLFDKSTNESKNELLVFKFPTMIFRGGYRSHYESTAYLYIRGSWDCVQSPPYPALEYATSCIRAADGRFRLLASPRPDMVRAKDAFYRAIRDVVSIMDILAILSATPGPPPAGCWMAESSKLCVAMFRNFEDPGWGKVANANFLRWASGPIPVRQDGVNFENKYFSISVDGGGVRKMVRGRKPQSPSNNCYVTIPVEIHFRLPEGAIRRMGIFLETTFA